MTDSLGREGLIAALFDKIASITTDADSRGDPLDRDGAIYLLRRIVAAVDGKPEA